MIIFDNKFNIGEEVYLITQVPIKYECPICEGEGKIVHNGYEMGCPKCQGHGKLCDDKSRVWEVMNGTFTINSIKANCNGESVTMRYKVSGYNRAEYNLFKSVEDAEKRCKELNCKIHLESE